MDWSQSDTLACIITMCVYTRLSRTSCLRSTSFTSTKKYLPETNRWISQRRASSGKMWTASYNIQLSRSVTDGFSSCSRHVLRPNLSFCKEKSFDIKAVIIFLPTACMDWTLRKCNMLMTSSCQPLEGEFTVHALHCHSIPAHFLHILDMLLPPIIGSLELVRGSTGRSRRCRFCRGQKPIHRKKVQKKGLFKHDS